MVYIGGYLKDWVRGIGQLAMGSGMEMELINCLLLTVVTSALKMEAVCPSKMLTYSQNTTQLNNSNDHHLFLHCCENLTFCRSG
jgi:hypothetical protein